MGPGPLVFRASLSYRPSTMKQQALALVTSVLLTALAGPAFEKDFQRFAADPRGRDLLRERPSLLAAGVLTVILLQAFLMLTVFVFITLQGRSSLGFLPVRDHSYFVYILASQRNGTLYIGVTNELARRSWQHKNGIIEGFTAVYRIKMLVYYEHFSDIRAAIAREKVLKKWKRAWKIALIERANPTWMDLYNESVGGIASLPGTVFQ